MFRYVIISISLFLILLPSKVFSEAQWQESGVPVCIKEKYQYNHSGVPDGDGGVIFSWVDYSIGFGNEDIYVQKINQDGTTPWGSEGVLIAGGTDKQDNPIIKSDGSGGAVIVWNESNTTTVQRRWYCQRVNTSGDKLWDPNGITICAYASDKSVFQILTSASGFYIAWTDDRNGSYDVYAQYFDFDGQPKWDINGLQICDQIDVQYPQTLIGDLEGGCIIIYGYGDSSFKDDLYAQRVDQLGVKQWAGNGVVICNADQLQYNPQCLWMNDSNLLIGWTDQRNDKDDIYIQKLSMDGSLEWSGGLPFMTSVNNQVLYNIVSDGQDGGLLLVDHTAPDGKHDVYGQRIDENGNKLWPDDGLIICNASGDQIANAIVPDGYGGALFSWTDSRDDETQFYLQYYDLNGMFGYPINGQSIVPNNYYKIALKTISVDSDEVIFIWSHQSDPDDYETMDIYAQKWKFPLVNVTYTPTITPTITPGPIVIKSNQIIAYPNPGKDQMNFMFQVIEDSNVKIEIFNMNGEKIAMVEEYKTTSDNAVVTWNCSGVAPGIYFVKTQVGDKVLKIKKIAIVH